jgi:hypothetical protein
MSRPNVAVGACEETIDVHIYYDGLETKHCISLKPKTTFFELKEILSRPEYAAIPAENQKLLYCGIPRDTDTLEMRGVQSRRFRVCIVRVTSAHDMKLGEEEGRAVERAREVLGFVVDDVSQDEFGYVVASIENNVDVDEEVGWIRFRRHDVLARATNSPGT